jgi:GT2 family glycosyltransferase/glycosyltransferase involved in cell wall biosynthesis
LERFSFLNPKGQFGHRKEGDSCPYGADIIEEKEMALLLGLKVLVFSKDRPLQLDGTLRSFFARVSEKGVSVTVLYTTSSPQQEDLYRKVQAEFSQVNFIRETVFKQNLLQALVGCRYVLFLVDDNIFVRDFSLEENLEDLSAHPQALGYSLRLGENTTYCYSLNRSQPKPVMQVCASGTRAFTWVGAEADYGYPLEVSSSIYRASDILPLLSQLEYKNPNSLEGHLAESVSALASRLPLLLCPPQSLTFCAPINKVQSVADNRAGERFGISAEALAEEYRLGRRLDVQSYYGFVPNACHQEVELVLTPPAARAAKVAVIIPCYKQAEYLGEAVASVAAQTYKDWECYIVNDGSPDNTSDVARKLITQYADKNLFLIEKPNGGLADARNYGIAATNAEYILPLDCDDCLEPHAIERLVSAIRHSSEYDIAYPNYTRFGADQGAVVCIREAEFLNPGRCDNGLPYCSLFRRTVWEKVQGYNTNMTWGYEDWDFWLGAFANGVKAKHVEEFLFRYRVKTSSMLTNALKHDAELKSQLVLNHKNLFNTESLAWAEKIGGTRASRKFPPPKNAVQVVAKRPEMAPLETSVKKVTMTKESRDWSELQSLFQKCKAAPSNRRISRQLAEVIDSLRFSAYSHLASGARDHYLKLGSGSVQQCLAIVEQLLSDSTLFKADLHEMAAILAIQEPRLDIAVAHLKKAIACDPQCSGAQVLLETIEAENPTTSVESSAAPCEVSIVIPLYNARNYTEQMLNSLFQTIGNISHEIIVVDNASSDGTRELLEKQQDKIRSIFNQANRNFSGACNQGAALATGRFILFLNSDTILLPNWLPPMLSVMAKDSKVGVVGNKHIYPDSEKLHHAGICFDNNKHNSHYLVGADKNDPRVGFERDFQAVNGACFLIRRELFSRVGGFDEAYKNGCEDVELCLKVREAGFRVVYTPDSVIYHYGQRSPGRGVNDDKNMQLFMQRWASKIQPDVELLQRQDAAMLSKHVKPTQQVAMTNVTLSSSIYSAEAIAALSQGGQKAPAVLLASAIETVASQAPREAVIGVDARTLTLEQSIERGIGHYSFNHIKAVIEGKPDWHFKLFAESQEQSETMRELEKLAHYSNVEVLDVAKIREHKLDLFHIMDPMCLVESFDNPFRYTDGVKLSLVFFDLIPLCRRAEHFDRWRPLTRRAYMSRLRELRQSGAQVLSISENTAKDLEIHAGIDRERLTVILAGLNKSALAAPSSEQIQKTLKKYGIHKKFFLTVGALDSHKNFQTTANAFVSAQAQEQMQLVLVGSMNDGAKKGLKETFAQRGINNVVFTGFVPREELECLYAAARALVYPSLYEGFGFPVLEAMAAGCPVLTTDVTSIPEVAGDAAIMLPPGDVRGFADAMIMLCKDEGTYHRLVASGRRQAEKFTWGKVAAITIKTWEQLLLANSAECYPEATKLGRQELQV